MDHLKSVSWLIFFREVLQHTEKENVCFNVELNAQSFHLFHKGSHLRLEGCQIFRQEPPFDTVRKHTTKGVK